MVHRLHRFAAVAATEAKLFLREPAAAFFQIAFPVLLLALFGTLFGELPLGRGESLRVIDFYLPALIGAFIGQAAILNLPIILVKYRKLGILKRFHATPLSLPTYLTVHIVVQFGALLVMAGVMAGTAELLFDVHFRGHLLVVLLVGLLGTASFFAFGFALSGLIGSPEAGQAIGSFLFLTMFFLSGAAVPRSQFPEWLVTVSWASPMTHVVEVLSGVWLGESLLPHWPSLLVLVGLFPVGVVVSLYTFRWED